MGGSDLPKPETHCGPGDSKVGGDPQGRLASPSSTCGLDDETNLVAPSEAIRPAGTVTKACFTLLLETPQPLVPLASTEARQAGSFDGRHSRKDSLDK